MQHTNVKMVHIVELNPVNMDTTVEKKRLIKNDEVDSSFLALEK